MLFAITGDIFQPQTVSHKKHILCIQISSDIPVATFMLEFHLNILLKYNLIIDIQPTCMYRQCELDWGDFLNHFYSVYAYYT